MLDAPYLLLLLLLLLCDQINLQHHLARAQAGHLPGRHLRVGPPGSAQRVGLWACC
jgi:hypothetical protein